LFKAVETQLSLACAHLGKAMRQDTWAPLCTHIRIRSVLCLSPNHSENNTSSSERGPFTLNWWFTQSLRSSQKEEEIVFHRVKIIWWQKYWWDKVDLKGSGPRRTETINLFLEWSTTC